MTEHTQEPWSERADSLQFVTVSDASCQIVAQVPRRPGSSSGANARRIVACVNACAGIPTEALENATSGRMRNGTPLATTETYRRRKLADAALDMLTGEG